MREINLEGKKQSIRDAKAMRSAASKVYKSGAREFGGDVRNPFPVDEAKRIRKNRVIKTALPIGLSIPAYNILTGKIYDNVFPYGY